MPAVHQHLLSTPVPRILADSLRKFLPEEVRSNITGEGWCQGTVSGLAPKKGFAINVSGGGLSAWGIPLISINAGIRTGDSSELLIDSVVLRNQDIYISTDGKIKLNKGIPDYNLRIAASMNSIPVPDIGGSFRVTGSARAGADLPRIQLMVTGEKIKYRDIFIGNQELLIQSKGEKVSISNNNPHSNNAIKVSVVIERPFSTAPNAKCELNVGSAPIISLLKRNPDISRPDSAYLNMNAEGWVDTFNVALEAGINMPGLNGILTGAMIKNRSKGAPMVWKLDQKQMVYNGVPVSVHGRGKLYGDSLEIDSLSVFDGIRGNGKLYLNSKPVLCEANLRYEMEIRRLLSLLPSKYTQVEKGMLSGSSRISGTLEALETRSEVHIKNLTAGGLNGLQTDAVVTTVGSRLRILPLVIRKEGRLIAAFDTLVNDGQKFSISGEFEDLDIKSLFGTLIPENMNIDSRITGSIRSTAGGFPLAVHFTTLSFKIDRYTLDSLTFSGNIDFSGIWAKQLRAIDGNRVTISADGFIPWAMLGEEPGDKDTLRASIEMDGDLLASLEKNVDSPIGGHGRGKARIAFYGVPGHWTFTTGSVTIPSGKLKVTPFVLDDIKNFTFSMNIDSSAHVNTNIYGVIRRRPIRIFSNHNIPHGYESFKIGPLDFGVIQVETPKQGIHIHLPGFMPLGEVGDIEFAAKKPFRNFTLSGPIEKLRITGTWIMRDLEFTFPFLATKELLWEVDPFPFVTWELDLRPGNRKMMYFWDLAGKRRRIMRFVEAYIDPTSLVKVRGRDLDKNFRLYGIIRSYKGAAYYGKVFDRNFDVGVEFVPQQIKNGRGYDNMPILWGSSEAFADTSRFDRIKLTCLVQNPLNNGVSERGRLVEGKKLNVTFHLSSDFEELPGESERDFYRQAGLNFTTLSGAGELVSNFGEQYFHRYLLQKWERRVAKSVGLDVLNIESSIASNYFNKLYSRQFDGLVNQYDYLALANVGVTVGRYFFRDFLFFKARGELIPIDTVLTPEYSIGLEFQPSRYLSMDFNYGIHKGETDIEHNPKT